MKFIRYGGIVLLVLVILIAFAWAYGALHSDGPSIWLAVVQALAILTVFVLVKPFFYQTPVTPKATRERFCEHVRVLNKMRDQPRWCNAIITNCTPAIRSQDPAAQRMAWDWRLLVHGKADELIYERQAIVTGGLPFAELKQRALIGAASKAANDDPDFSTRIRAGRPGMESSSFSNPSFPPHSLPPDKPNRRDSPDRPLKPNLQ